MGLTCHFVIGDRLLCGTPTVEDGAMAPLAQGGLGWLPLCADHAKKEHNARGLSVVHEYTGKPLWPGKCSCTLPGCENDTCCNLEGGQ